VTAPANRLLHIAAALLATILVASCAVWGALALWYQGPGGHALKILAVALWASISAACIVALWTRRVGLGLLGFALAFGGLDRRYPLEELRSLGYLSERAKEANGRADFSAAVRQGVPPLN
jgi:hypothetical protein